jgi:hypothetical protein
VDREIQSLLSFIPIAIDLEHAGLLWRPEIGDEIKSRSQEEQVSILVDPQGKTPSELRLLFLWLPTVEQIINQVEARSGILFHAGLELYQSKLCYKTVLQIGSSTIENEGDTFRASLGKALRDLLLLNGKDSTVQ